MKLETHYNRVTVAATLIVLLIAAIGYYFMIHYVLIGQLDEALKVEEVEIHDYISKHNKLPDATVYKDQRIAFEKTDHTQHRSFNSLSAFHPGENEMESSRQLLFTVEVNGQIYMASVTKSEESTEDLVWIILFSTLGLLVLLTVILFFTNRFLLKKLWKPFHNTLSSIKEFNLSAPVDIKMQATQITEFNELNESIRMMAKKVMNDYQSLKNFTDHASHEMQTPLAIIHTKLDVLIQEPELSEKSMEQIHGIYNAVEKLSRLSQALLLLTRIENNQYNATQDVSINQILEEKILELQEWIRVSDLDVTIYPNPVNVNMSKELAEILVGNLLRNAIIHSMPGTNIEIQTKEQSLSISNAGVAALDTNKITDRFYKSDNSGGNGLGLAIVKQICDQYGFRFSYVFSQHKHIFSIEF